MAEIVNSIKCVAEVMGEISLTQHGSKRERQAGRRRSPGGLTTQQNAALAEQESERLLPL